MSIQPIILCGGSGNRLWPLSRRDLPKQFINIFAGKSLFEITIERTLKIKSDRLPIIVTNKKYKFLVSNILTKLKIEAKILLEPIGKDTAASIYLAAKLAHKNDELLIMPSDHLISQEREFIDVLKKKIRGLTEDFWIIFGIKPNNPSTSFGYIEVKNDQKILDSINNFIEKPNENLALKMFSKGNFLWNSGIFFGKADFIISSIDEFSPEVSKSCNLALKYMIEEDDKTFNFCNESFKAIPKISIDYAVLEKDKRIKCFELDIGWEDVGSFESFFRVVKDKSNKENSIQINGQNKIITNKNRLVATLGIENLTIVDSEDATLITTKHNDKELRSLLDYVAFSNPGFLKNRSFENRPWGRFDILLDTKDYKVKKLTIYPYKRLSLQYHEHRSEHWMIVKGIAYIHLDGKEFELKQGNSIDIKKKSVHFIQNREDTDLEIIEIQIGSYFGEDDIIRVDDPYKR